jgi:hypothetical protein
MPIYQNVIFVCEVCENISSYMEEVDLHSDPVIAPLNGDNWSYPDEKPNILHCPKCYEKIKNK